MIKVTETDNKLTIIINVIINFNYLIRLIIIITLYYLLTDYCTIRSIELLLRIITICS
jgi:hypothetical protein